jgi:hypothetical protein
MQLMYAGCLAKFEHVARAIEIRTPRFAITFRKKGKRCGAM